MINTIWISEKGIKEKQNLAWVDLNILPKQGKAIGGHIISLDGEVPKGFQTSCNPNILAEISAQKFHQKFQKKERGGCIQNFLLLDESFFLTLTKNKPICCYKYSALSHLV